MALDTCAADGLCATTCPVSIDTGKLVKRFRALRNSAFAKGVAKFTVDYFALVESLVRLGLAAGHLAEHIVGVEGMQAITGAMRKVIGPNMPLWTAEMPYATRGRHPSNQSLRRAGRVFPCLYFARHGPASRRTQSRCL